MHTIPIYFLQIKKHGTGENLEKGQQVRMKYTLMLSSGKIVDDNVEQTFQLGDGEVIDGGFSFLLKSLPFCLMIS